MKHTEHYNLNLPEANDLVSTPGQGPVALNENAENIDAELHRLDTQYGEIAPLTGSVNPTNLTVGAVGQKYTNLLGGNTFVCTDESNGMYTWLPVAAYSNPNLLHNWGAPFVNQRGQSSYMGYGIYTIDRWVSVASETVLEVISSGVTLTSSGGADAYIQQRLEQSVINALIGKTVTISILLANGDLHVATGIFGVNDVSASFTEGVISIFSSERAFVIRARLGEVLQYTAVKLELGSVSTLKNDPPPDEVNKPAIYRFQRLYSTNNVNTQGQTSPPMRITPVVTQLTSGDNAGMYLYDANL